MRKKNICKIDGCDSYCEGRGLCRKHYMRMMRGNDPEKRTRFDPNDYILTKDTAEIILRNRAGEEVGRAIVDREDFPKISKHIWSLSAPGYAYRQHKHEGKSTIKLHQEIIKIPDGMFCDHINNNKLDNRKSNLRVATPRQNAQNQSLISKKKYSKYKGVCFLKRQDCVLKKPWVAYINDATGKRRHLGFFATEEDAAHVYNEAAVEHHGEFANINELPA